LIADIVGTARLDSSQASAVVQSPLAIPALTRTDTAISILRNWAKTSPAMAPSRELPSERAGAQERPSRIPREVAQWLLDELAARLNAGTIRVSPTVYLAGPSSARKPARSVPRRRCVPPMHASGDVGGRQPCGAFRCQATTLRWESRPSRIPRRQGTWPKSLCGFENRGDKSSGMLPLAGRPELHCHRRSG
jgi:hypothetical protein